MAETVLAEHFTGHKTPGSHTELAGTPGAYTTYSIPGGLPQRGVDVACPGCGEKVYALRPDKYTVVGPDDLLSCKEPIDFVCCGPWRLDHGTWIR